MQGLIKQGHQVSLATISTNATTDQESLKSLTNAGIDVHYVSQPRLRSMLNAVTALPSQDPLQSVYSWQPDLAESLKSLLNSNTGNDRYDIVHVEHLRGSKYALFVKGLRLQPGYSHLLRTPIIWDSVDSISYLFRQASRSSRKLTSRLITRLELPRTERYERSLATAFDQVLVTSPVDQQAYYDICGDIQAEIPISILPNGVEINYFSPIPFKEKESNTIVISGKMSYHANITMVHNLYNNIMPLIWSSRPEIQLWIVGKDPDGSILRLNQHPNVLVTGTVPDIRPYIQKATVAVAPIQYGAGIQNKVLEAMACGTPVVCADQATSALQARPGVDLFTANDAPSFAQATLDLLADPILGEKIANSGRKYVETYHDWDKITTKLLEIYTHTLANIQSKTNRNLTIM